MQTLLIVGCGDVARRTLPHLLGRYRIVALLRDSSQSETWRAQGVLPLVADLGRLNMSYPTLKIFVDVVDDNLPRLMVCNTLQLGAGLTPEQLQLFMSTAMTAMKQLYGECEQAGYLNPPEASETPMAVH